LVGVVQAGDGMGGTTPYEPWGKPAALTIV
jgi:hypothetical protein